MRKALQITGICLVALLLTGLMVMWRIQVATNANGTLTAAGAADLIALFDGESTNEPNTRFEDTVSGFHFAPKSGALFLNFGGVYPHAVLTVWIPNSYASNFSRPTLEALVGHKVRVTGEGRIYKKKPEVVVHTPDQIVDLGK